MLNNQIIQILWLVITLIAIIVFYVSVKSITRCINNKIFSTKEINMLNIKYDKDLIISHLDFIINEALDNYIAMNIVPKNTYYITNQMENDITDKLVSIVSDRIPPLLYSKLSLIYDPKSIGTVIGQRIYTAVLEYVISFNVQNENKATKK